MFSATLSFGLTFMKMEAKAGKASKKVSEMN